MQVSKDIHINHPPQHPSIGAPPLLARTGTLKAESLQQDDEVGRSKEQKSDFTAKADNPDNIFVEDVGPSHSTTKSTQLIPRADHHRDKLPLW